MLPSATSYVAAQVLGLAGYEGKYALTQPTDNGQGLDAIQGFQKEIK